MYIRLEYCRDCGVHQHAQHCSQLQAALQADIDHCARRAVTTLNAGMCWTLSPLTDACSMSCQQFGMGSCRGVCAGSGARVPAAARSPAGACGAAGPQAQEGGAAGRVLGRELGGGRGRRRAEEGPRQRALLPKGDAQHSINCMSVKCPHHRALSRAARQRLCWPQSAGEAADLIKIHAPWHA